MAYKKMEIVQGDSSKTITAKADGVLSSDWSGKIVVKQKLGAVESAVLTVVMTLDVAENKLYGTLVPDDTIQLAEGTSYFLTVEIENLNSTPAYRKEIKKYDLVITAQGA